MAFSSGGGGGRAPLSEINVTPMVDVMLVLLVIFMVAAPMLTTGVEVDLPQAQTPQMDLEDEKHLLTIAIDPRCLEPGAAHPCQHEPQVYLGRDQIPYERLEETLRRTPELQGDESEIFVQGDALVPYGFAVRVFATIRRAGISKVGLVTDPLGSEQ